MFKREPGWEEINRRSYGHVCIVLGHRQQDDEALGCGGNQGVGRAVGSEGGRQKGHLYCFQQ